MNTPHPKGEVAIINTLRAIAALMVSYYHFAWHSDPTGWFFTEDHPLRYYGYQGQIGVYVFFVISGFVIPYALYVSRFTIKNYFRFLAKRIARLHPPFVASMLLFAALAIGYALKEGVMVQPDWNRILHNFFLTARFVDVPWYEDVYWTLAIEFQYYIFIALIFPLLIHKKEWVGFLVLILFVLSAQFFDHDRKHILFFHAPVFTAGIALFLHRVNKLNDLQFIALLAWCMFETRYEIGPEVAVALSITAAAVVMLNWRSKITDFLGNISYSLYLIHGFIGCQFLYFMARYAETTVEKIGMLLAAFALSIAASWLFYRAFEVPSVRWSKKIKYKP
jgi:peptidoglycan/LPS O-acetylase OafA/YrhL